MSERNSHLLDWHRIDRQARANQFDDRRNVFDFEQAAAAFELCVFQCANAGDRIHM
jgi:hypothetical protein